MGFNLDITMDTLDSPRTPYDEEDQDQSEPETMLSRASSLVQSMFGKARSMFSPTQQEPVDPYCGDACEKLEYIPEQGSYGTCSIISIVSLVLKTPCLMDYLRIKNPDAHYYLEQIEKKTDGSFVRSQVEDDVCPYLPPSVWKHYFDNFQYEKDIGPEMQQQIKIMRDYTTRQRFSDQTRKTNFLKGFYIELFMEALFGGSGIDYFPFKIWEYFRLKIPMTNQYFSLLKSQMPDISNLKMPVLFKFRPFRNVVKPPLYSIETTTKRLKTSQNSYKVRTLEVHSKFKEFILDFYDQFQTHMADQGFYIVPYLIISGDKDDGGDHKRHAILGRVCNRKNDVTLCSWGECTPNNSAAAEMLAGYSFDGFYLVCVPRDFNPQSWG